MQISENISAVADESRLSEVTIPALVQRINRVLRKEGEQLRKSRGLRFWSDLGDYYIVDLYRNFIVAGHVDLESLGRELRVLRESERLSED